MCQIFYRERETCNEKCRCTALSICSLDGLELMLTYSLNYILNWVKKKLSNSAEKCIRKARSQKDLQGWSVCNISTMSLNLILLSSPSDDTQTVRRHKYMENILDVYNLLTHEYACICSKCDLLVKLENTVPKFYHKLLFIYEKPYIFLCCPTSHKVIGTNPTSKITKNEFEQIKQSSIPVVCMWTASNKISLILFFLSL